MKRNVRKKVSISFITVCLSTSMLLQGITIQAKTVGEVSVHESNGEITIGNDYIERTFSTQNDTLITTEVNNKRIDKTLVPQSGSADFLINTIYETDEVDVIPTKTLDRTKWSGKITNEKNTAKVVDAKNLFDGNDTTQSEYWDSGASTYPYFITIDLGEEKTFESLSFQKRVGDKNVAWGINGSIGKFRLAVSEDGTNWTEAGKGEWTAEDYNLHTVGNIHNVGDLVYASFDQPQTSRYVQLIMDSGAFGGDPTFCGSEIRLYEDAYVKAETETEIASTDLTLKDTVVSEIENGKKVDFQFESYTLNDIRWDLTYVVVMNNQDHFMRTYVEAKADVEDYAKIDYIDLDHFVLGDEVEGVWSRPDDFKVSANAYSFQETEMLLGQPIYADGMFFGSEFPATDTQVENDVMQVRYYSGKSFSYMRNANELTTDGKFVSWPNVVGSARGTDSDVVQIDFFAYIDSISTPTEFRKQYNSWYDNTMGITDESIAKAFFGSEKGLSQNGVEPLDSYVVDDGWNNYNDPEFTGIDVRRSGTSYNQTGFWEFNDKFPDELYPAKEMSAKFDSSFGLWLGPQGGYELQGTFSQYIDSQETGYLHPSAALGKVICAGSHKYITNLTKLFTDYQQRFDIDYWKLDGFASRPCTQADHDHMVGGYKNMYFTSDLWEKWTDAFEVMRAQRATEGKGLFINATCYVNPSPWMLQWVNTVWMQNDGDLAKYGSGSDADKMIAGRDEVYFTNYRKAQLQFPLRNVYNHDPIYGVSANVSMNTDEFRQYMMLNAVRGTAFWELYFSPSMMDDAKWKVTADVMEFVEENFHILENAKLFGSAPSQNGVYGYSSWDGDEGIISFRNPTNAKKTYELKLDEKIGVPADMKNLKQTQVLPYVSELGDVRVSYGDTITVELDPYEEIIYQYGMKNKKPLQVEYAKATAENKVLVKFNQRVKDHDVYTVNDVAASSMNLMDDYRTVELTMDEDFTKDQKITLKINQVQSISGAELTKEISLTAYEEDVITKAEEKADLQESGDVKEVTFERNGKTLMQFDQKAYALQNENSLNETTKDYTISMMLQTSSKNTGILASDENFTMRIDENGYLVYEDDTVSLSSKQDLTKVVEKAHGTFNTEAYVPTSTQQITSGKINDGNMHTVAVTREMNGMTKLYIDGELSNTSYQDGEEATFTSKGMLLGSDGFIGKVADVSIMNRAMGYDEIKTLYSSYDFGEAKKLDKSAWIGSADSEETKAGANEGPVKNAFDDNTSTLWHTQYNGAKPKCPHWMMIDFGKQESFDRLEYVSRNGNGSVKDYTIEISDDGTTWKEIYKGTFEKAGTQTIDFETTQSAQFMKLNVTSSYGVDAANENIFAAVAEVSLYKVFDAMTDASALASLVEEAKAYKASDYTVESFNVLTEEIAKAVSVLQNVNATQQEVDAAVEALQTAIDQLEEFKAADKEALAAVIEEASAYTQEEYTTYSWATFASALENAKTIYGTEQATQEAVDNAKTTLQEAMRTLVKRVDKSELQSLLDLVKDYKETTYTPETWVTFKEAIDHANTVITDENATQEKVNLAKEALQDAIKNLVEVTPEEVHKEALLNLIKEISEYDESIYTADSWAKLQDAVHDATVVAESKEATQAEVDLAYQNLTEAVNALKIAVDFSELEAVMQEAKTYAKEEFTEESFKNLEEKLTNAEQVLVKENVTQDEIDTMITALKNAIKDLKKIEIVNKTDLVNAIAEYEPILSLADAYTAESFASFKTAFENATIIVKDEAASQEQVDKAYANLQNAYDSLMKVPEEPEEPDTPTDPEQPEEPSRQEILETEEAGHMAIGAFQKDDQLIVTSIPQEDIGSLKDDALLSGYQLEQIFDIHIMRNGSVLDWKNETITLRLKLDASLYDLNLQIAYIDEEGNVEIISSIVKDGYIEFTTDHLSYYAILSEKSNSSTSDPEEKPIITPGEPAEEQPTAPNTGDSTNTVAFLLLLLGSGAVLHVHRKKIETNK